MKNLNNRQLTGNIITDVVSHSRQPLTRIIFVIKDKLEKRNEVALNDAEVGSLYLLMNNASLDNELRSKYQDLFIELYLKKHIKDTAALPAITALEKADSFLQSLASGEKQVIAPSITVAGWVKENQQQIDLYQNKQNNKIQDSKIKQAIKYFNNSTNQQELLKLSGQFSLHDLFYNDIIPDFALVTKKLAYSDLAELAEKTTNGYTILERACYNGNTNLARNLLNRYEELAPDQLNLKPILELLAASKEPESATIILQELLNKKDFQQSLNEILNNNITSDLANYITLALRNNNLPMVDLLLKEVVSHSLESKVLLEVLNKTLMQQDKETLSNLVKISQFKENTSLNKENKIFMAALKSGDMDFIEILLE